MNAVCDWCNGEGYIRDVFGAPPCSKCKIPMNLYLEIPQALEMFGIMDAAEILEKIQLRHPEATLDQVKVELDLLERADIVFPIEFEDGVSYKKRGGIE